MNLKLLILTVVSMMCMFVGNAFATPIGDVYTMTFDEAPLNWAQEGHGDYNPLISGDYIIYTNSANYGSVIRRDPSLSPYAIPDNGTNNIGTTYYTAATIERLDGGLFDLISLDFAEYSEYVNTGMRYITGFFADGSTIQEILYLDGIMDGPGELPDFQTITLDSKWRNLQKVMLDEVTSYDDIAVMKASPVPEPATLFLIGTGLIYIAGTQRKRRPIVSQS